MTPELFLASVRSSNPEPSALGVWDPICCQQHQVDGGFWTEDENAGFREWVTQALARTLNKEDLQLARFLTEQEILMYQRCVSVGIDENMRLCTFILFNLGAC